MMNNIEELKKFLSVPRRIIITTHQRADGDAMGSSLALFHYLKLKGHQPTVISPTDYPDFLKWLPGNDEVIIYESNKELSENKVKEAEVIFCLDFNKLYRLDDLGKLIEGAAVDKVLIDHHLEPDSFARYQLWSVNASSTSELVFNFLSLMDDGELLNTTIATCLYTGILTDTDRFRVPTTSAEVHRITARLLESGIDHTNIYQQVYESFSEKRLRMLGYCIAEKLEVIPELRTGIITLDQADLKKFGLAIGDTEGIVNYPLWIKEVVVSALITQRPREIKLSLRSKGDFSVERIGREVFNGGGHRNAAGGTAYTTVAETRVQLISTLARFKKELHDILV